MNTKPIKATPAKKHPTLKNILNIHHNALKTPDKIKKTIAKTNNNANASILNWYLGRDLNPHCASVAQLLVYKTSVLTIKLPRHILKP